MNQDNLSNITEQLQNKENNHKANLSAEILQDLKKFKEVLEGEIRQNFSEELNGNNETIRKKVYQIQHLKQSYLELFQKYQNDMSQLQIENQTLQQKLSELQK